MTYVEAIREGFLYLLRNYPNVFVIGQGLWSPWYVGQSMRDLEKEFGKHRVLDTPVSENACTAAAIGASLFGYRPIVVHPRIDFMVLATDAIVNQAAKWHHMLGGQASPAVTIRGIINRGGEQGAQHSQALHAWYAHVPGLRVVMPATVRDARDLLISSVLSDAPVVYIDDRWLYERQDDIPPIEERPIAGEKPQVLREGRDLTLVGAGYTTYLCEQAARDLAAAGISAEVLDLRVLNPLHPAPIVRSVEKTGRLMVVDGGWKNVGLASEIVASIAEQLEPARFRAKPVRLCLPDAPAPTSGPLEQAYYTTVGRVIEAARLLVDAN